MALRRCRTMVVAVAADELEAGAMAALCAAMPLLLP
jgi:hypothetical protein